LYVGTVVSALALAVAVTATPAAAASTTTTGVSPVVQTVLPPSADPAQWGGTSYPWAGGYGFGGGYSGWGSGGFSSGYPGWALGYSSPLFGTADPSVMGWANWGGNAGGYPWSAGGGQVWGGWAAPWWGTFGVPWWGFPPPPPIWGIAPPIGPVFPGLGLNTFNLGVAQQGLTGVSTAGSGSVTVVP
jgi:hypothetical protein